MTEPNEWPELQELAPPPRGMAARIFLTPDVPRLRAGWRLALFAVLLFVLLVALEIPVAVYQHLFGLLGSELLFWYGLTSLLAITLAVWFARRWFDHRTLISLGLRVTRATLWDLLVGVLISGVLMGGIFLLFLALGWLHITGVAWRIDAPDTVLTQSLLVIFIIGLFPGWSEELLSRGYLLQNLADGLTLPWAIAISSAIFGVLHLSNPGATWQGVVGITLAGLMLAYAWLRTGQLWLSIGLHAGWNICEGLVFGFPVSGIDGILYHLIRQRTDGPTAITGGAFGPEAGLIMLPVMALNILLIEAWVHLYPHPTQRAATLTA